MTSAAASGKPGLSAIARCAALGGLIVVLGCESVSQDLNDFASNLFPPTPFEAALMANDEYDPDRRREGTLLLSNAPFGGDEEYLRLYRLRVEADADPLVRAVAIRALAKHGTPADALLIAPHLEDENVQVRWEAAKGLQRLHNREVIVPLLASLRDVEEDADVRVAVAIALGQYPEDQAFQGLVGALSERELSVNMAAGEALETLTGQSFELDARPWLAWYKENADSAFANGREYLYPTYQREDSFLERVAFWSSRPQEESAQPAGLRPESERRTYGDAPASEGAGSAAGDGSDASSGDGSGRRTYEDSDAPSSDASAQPE